MNKTRKLFRVMFLMVCLCCVLPGCSVLQNGIREYSSDKEQCHLVSEDVTQFTYKGETYTILDKFRKRLKPPLLKPYLIWQRKHRTPNTSSRF